MKKMYMSASILTAVVALSIAGPVFAQTTNTATIADQISHQSSFVAAIDQIEAARQSILISAANQFVNISFQIQTLANMPLKKADDRAQVSAQLQAIQSQVVALSALVSGLEAVKTEESSLLVNVGNNLIALQNQLSI